MKKQYLLNLFIILGIHCFGYAQQDDNVLLEQLSAQDSGIVSEVIQHPESIRTVILEASMHPEIIARIEVVQKKSSEGFFQLISSYEKEEQKEIWDITRYPGLVEELTSGGKKSKTEIAEILKNYPEEIHKTATKQGKENYSLLVKINELNKNSNQDFTSIIKDSPTAVQATFRQLLQQPDVLSMLSQNIQEAILLGDIYKSNPVMVKQKLDALNSEYTIQRAKEVEDWKKSLEENPEVKKEFYKSAEEYARENGYDAREYKTRKTEVIVNYTIYPYPYWFGYPRWHASPYWYPYPYWYDWGFYYGPQENIIVVGLPSYYFTYWYFNQPHHHYNHPYLSHHFVNYYEGHHNSYSGYRRGVTRWERDNRNYLSEDWLRNDGNRPNRLKEYGRLEMDRGNYNRRNPQNNLERDEYLRKNQEQYPKLKPITTEEKERMRARPSPQTSPRPPSGQQLPPQKQPERKPAPQPQPQPVERKRQPENVQPKQKRSPEQQPKPAPQEKRKSEPRPSKPRPAPPRN